MENLGKAFLGAIIATFIGSLMDGREADSTSDAIFFYGIRFIGYFIVFGVVAYFWGKKKVK